MIQDHMITYIQHLPIFYLSCSLNTELYYYNITVYIIEKHTHIISQYIQLLRSTTSRDDIR